MRRPVRTLIGFVVAALAAVAAAAPPADDALTARIDQIAAEALARPGGVGLSISVSRDGRFILSKGYGHAEAEHGARADEHAMFRIGSITKQFTAAAIMRLVEQGKIGLDDRITKYLPKYNTQGWQITVRHLLTHTSGIKSYTELRRVMQDEPEHEFKHEDLVALFQDEPVAFDPGTRFAYCNSGYYLLGMIIETVSGKSYCEYLQDEFFGPLGLEHTRCDSNDQVIVGRAQGYRLTAGKLRNDRGLATGTPFAAGVLIASAHDLVAWSDALAAGKVVSAASYEQMTTPCELADGSTTAYGFGLFMDRFEGHRRVQHNGGIFGFNSAMARYPDDGLTVAVISNSETVPSDRILKEISRAALGVRDSKPKDGAISATDSARVIGTYTIATVPLDVRIFEKDGKLFAQGSGQPESGLLYHGGGEFRAAFDNEVKLVFDLSGTVPCDSFVLHQSGAVLTAKRK